MKNNSQCCDIVYKSCAFDGTYFYFLSITGDMVFVYTANFEACGSIHTQQLYSSICYDTKAACFWVSPMDGTPCLHVLDKDFDTCDIIFIHPIHYCENAVSQLVYDQVDDSICIVYKDEIIKYMKKTNTDICIYHDCSANIECLIPYSCGYLIIQKKDSCLWLVEVDRHCVFVHEHQIVKDISLYCFILSFDQSVYFLRQDEGSETCFCEIQCEISEVIDFLLHEDSICFDTQTYDDDTLIHLIIDMIKGHTPIQTPNYNDVIIAISQIESALACILQREGEQMLSHFKHDCSIEDFLCMNDRVEQFISTITKLEQSFVDQLKIFERLHCEDNQDIQ